MYQNINFVVGKVSVNNKIQGKSFVYSQIEVKRSVNI